MDYVLEELQEVNDASAHKKAEMLCRPYRPILCFWWPQYAPLHVAGFYVRK